MADGGSGTPAELDDLRQLILDKQVVAFVGAGVSIPPSHDWAHVVESLAARCGVNVDGRSELAVVDECIEKDEAGCNAYMREELAKHQATTRTLLNYIVRLPFQAILTTNFDPWLQQQSRAGDFHTCVVYPGLGISKGMDQRIYYLHGIFDSESGSSSVRRVVFGAASFARAYGEVSLLPGLLLDALTFRNILFIGFNPTEQHVSRILKSSIEMRRAIAPTGSREVPRRYLLRAEATKTDPEYLAAYGERTAQLEALEITSCSYPQIASDHRGLEKLLLGWVDQGELKNRPAPFAAGFSTGGA